MLKPSNLCYLSDPKTPWLEKKLPPIPKLGTVSGARDDRLTVVILLAYLERKNGFFVTSFTQEANLISP